MPDGLVLGFDTSAAHCAAALLSGDTVLLEAVEEMGRGQAERLMPLIEEMLVEAGVGWPDLHRIGVGVGPGNFTGIRISVATARGLSLSLGVPAVGVSLLEAAAHGAEGPVLACCDARGGRVYLELFGRGVIPDMPAAMADLEAVPAGLCDRGLACVGPAAAAVAERIGGEVVPTACSPAVAIAELAASRAVRPGERPAPLYIREADAAPPREAPPKMLP